MIKEEYKEEHLKKGIEEVKEFQRLHRVMALHPRR